MSKQQQQRVVALHPKTATLTVDPMFITDKGRTVVISGFTNENSCIYNWKSGTATTSCLSVAVLAGLPQYHEITRSEAQAIYDKWVPEFPAVAYVCDDGWHIFPEGKEGGYYVNNDTPSRIETCNWSRGTIAVTTEWGMQKVNYDRAVADAGATQLELQVSAL